MDSYTNMVDETNILFTDNTRNIVSNKLNLDWDNKLAIKRVYQTIKMLGKDPDVVGKDKNQSVIWYKPRIDVTDRNYDRIEIMDQSYHYLQPTKRGDFYFVSYRMEIKPNKIHDVSKINNSAFYYSRGSLVTVGCHYIGAALATFSVLKDYNNDKISLLQAKKELKSRNNKLFEEFEQDKIKYKVILEKYITSDNITRTLLTSDNNITRTLLTSDNNISRNSLTSEEEIVADLLTSDNNIIRTSSLLSEEEIVANLLKTSSLSDPAKLKRTKTLIKLPALPKLPFNIDIVSSPVVSSPSVVSLPVVSSPSVVSSPQYQQVSPEPVRVPKSLRLNRTVSKLNMSS